MRGEEIRAVVVATCDQAVALIAKVREKVPPELHAEVDRYEAATVALRDFWVDASPAFCHAWMQVTTEADKR